MLLEQGLEPEEGAHTPLVPGRLSTRFVPGKLMGQIKGNSPSK